MFKNKFLFLPIGIILIAFVLDKFLMHSFLTPFFATSLSDLNYESKPRLFQELKNYLKQNDRKKVIVYFGNSRSLLFDNEYIEQKFPEWILFNFSVPGGTPDYFLYWIEKFQSEDVHPDFVLLDESLESYNESASLKVDETLLHGLSFGFLLRHSGRYSKSELQTYVSQTLFQIQQDRPHIKVILERMKNHFEQSRIFIEFRESVRDQLAKERGSFSPGRDVKVVLPRKELQKKAASDFRSYLNPFTFNSEMLDMQRDSARILSSMDVPFGFICVKVSSVYYALYKNQSVSNPYGEPVPPFQIWFPKIQSVHQAFRAKLWNMNEDRSYTCDDFSDPGHMSPSCYFDFTNSLFNKLNSGFFTP